MKIPYSLTLYLIVSLLDSVVAITDLLHHSFLSLNKLLQLQDIFDLNRMA